MCTYVWQVQGYPLYHLVKAQTDKQAGAKEDALASLQTAMSFITSKKPGTQAVRLGKSIGCQFYMLQSVCMTYMYDLPVDLLVWMHVHVSFPLQYTCTWRLPVYMYF